SSILSEEDRARNLNLNLAPNLNLTGNCTNVIPKFQWDVNIQRNIFAADNIGTQILYLPVGYCINHFGAKYILAAGVLLASLGTLLIPAAAIHSGYIAVAVLRAIIGIGISTAWPSVYFICSRWSPKNQLGSSLALLASGLQVGPFLTMIFSG